MAARPVFDAGRGLCGRVSPSCADLLERCASQLSNQGGAVVPFLTLPIGGQGAALGPAGFVLRRRRPPRIGTRPRWALLANTNFPFRTTRWPWACATNICAWPSRAITWGPSLSMPKCSRPARSTTAGTSTSDRPTPASRISARASPTAAPFSRNAFTAVRAWTPGPAGSRTFRRPAQRPMRRFSPCPARVSGSYWARGT